MTRILGILTILLLTVSLVSGCGSAGSEFKSIMEKQADITEDYINGLEKAENAEDVVAAIDGYTENMKKLIPSLIEFHEKYPEFKEGNMPEEMKDTAKQVEEITAKIPGAMMKVTRYMMDSKVRDAMTRMGEEMSRLEN